MTNNTAIRRVNTDGLTPWRPGQSGNPSGRPKLGVGAYIRGHMDLGEWYRRVWAIACDPKDRDKVRALELLVNHAWGAPRQSVALSRDEDDPGLAAMRQLIAAIHGTGSTDVLTDGADVIDVESMPMTQLDNATVATDADPPCH